MALPRPAGRAGPGKAVCGTDDTRSLCHHYYVIVPITRPMAPPSVSVVVVTHDRPPEILARSLGSVLSQTCLPEIGRAHV